METGIFYALIAGLFWGSSPVLVKRGLVGSDVSAATLYQQATILLTLVLAAVLEGNLMAQRIAPLPLAVFIATGIVGAYLGRTLFVKSVAQIGASRAQSLNNSSPLITVLLAALLLGETLSPAVLGGVLLIIAGVFFVTTTNAQGEDSGAARTLTLTLTSIMATLCYGIVPVMKKFGTDLGGPPVLGALVMHATGLALLLTLGAAAQDRAQVAQAAAEQFALFRRRRRLAGHRFDPDAEGFALRAGFGGCADLEYPTDHQFHSHQGAAPRYRSRDLARRRRRRFGGHGCSGITMGLKETFKSSRFNSSMLGRRYGIA